MSRWTDEQQSAIEAEGCSVIVSAAAGSGKTSVLVERLIRIIADREKQIPVEKMIVVTFTRDAAAEMKQRLSAELSRMIEENPGDGWLARQNAMLGCASISTIASFCIDLLRKNICQLSFSSGFRIADDTEKAVLKSEAYKNTSEYFYSSRHDDMLLLRRNFCGADDFMLEKTVYELYDCISSVPFFDLWLDKAAEKYSDGEFERFYGEYLANDVEICRGLFEDAERAVDCLKNSKVSEIFESERDGFFCALEMFEKNDYIGFNRALSEIDFKRFPNPRKDDDRELRDEIISFRNSYKEIISGLIENSMICFYADEDMEKNREIFSAVSDFLKHFNRELSGLMERKNVMGFDDSERITLSLLADVKPDGTIEKTTLAKELSDSYELIMVDEFQDTNNRQDMIFRLLSKGGTAEKYGGNLFFVGDVKQSIYRFRLANPDNFINALENAVPYKKGCAENSYIRLSRNFRSSGEVIRFANYLFSCIMTKQCGDIDYTEEEYLYQGASFCEAERKPVVMLFDKSDNSVENTEARCVAEKISKMLSEGVPVSENGGTRPCEMRDFCILMRGNKNIKLYAKELERLGISAESAGESGYLRSREIAVLINLLKAADNPLLDTPLMSVMLSPMFMFTADEAAQVRLVDKESGIYLNLCKGIGLNDAPELFEGDLLLKCRTLYSVINEIRLYSGAYTLQELVRKIYDRTEFMSVMQLYGDAERKKANLRMLLEYVGNYEKNYDGGLSGFVRYIDQIMDSGSDFEMAPDTHGMKNAVAIKTMHRSKGLEFPFVFIVGTDSRFNSMDNAQQFQFSYEYGLGFKVQNPEKFQRYSTLPYNAINILNRLSFIGEEMRLLYVAVTRAKERVFITMDRSESAVKKADKLAKLINRDGITPSASASVNSMGDWIMMCLIAHSKSAKLREIFGIYECFKYDDDFEIEYELCEPGNYRGENIKSTKGKKKNADSEMVKKLEDMFAFEYDLSQASLTAKLSVSDISKNDSEFEAPLRRPDFTEDANGLTPAERGTALHKFLQFADFKALETDIGAELENLCRKGYLTVKQRDSVKESDVRAFMDSEIYRRVKNCGRVRRERKFLVAIDDLELDSEYCGEYKNTSGMLNGIIDMVLEFEDHLVLVDYKTDRVSDINELAERYGAQLTLYKKTLEKIENKPVTETLIYSFYKKRELSVAKEEL